MAIFVVYTHPSDATFAVKCKRTLAIDSDVQAGVEAARVMLEELGLTVTELLQQMQASRLARVCPGVWIVYQLLTRKADIGRLQQVRCGLAHLADGVAILAAGCEMVKVERSVAPPAE